MKQVYIENQSIFPDLLGKNPIAMDLGARFGEFTFPFLDRFGGVVESYEPISDAVNRFVEIRSGKGYSEEQAPIFRKAVWIRGGQQEFQVWEGPGLCLGSFYSDVRRDRDPTPNRTALVDTITLDDALAKHSRIDLLKMDIEGAEFDIIGSPTAGSLCDKVMQITLEIHPYCRNRKDIGDILRKMGFRIHDNTSPFIIAATNRALHV